MQYHICLKTQFHLCHILKSNQTSLYSITNTLPARGGPMIPARPRPIDNKPNALVSLPIPKSSQIMMDVSEIKEAENESY